MKRIVTWIVVPSMAARLVLVWTGACEGNLVADDAYYYFTIAKNIAGGLGPTFDRITATNGFHPLWQFTLVPLFSWTSALWTPVRMALSLTILCDAASGILVVLLANRLWPSPSARWIAAALWFLFPVSALIGLRGMEASAGTLLILSTLWISIRAVERGLKPSTAILAGVGVALCGLARTDNLPGVGLAVVAVAVATSREGVRWPRIAAWSLVTASTAVLLLAPWFIWNWRHFGALIQVSGLAKLHANQIYGDLPAWGSSAPDFVRALAHRALAPIVTPVRYIAGEEFHSTWITPVVALAAALLFVAPAASAAGCARKRGPRAVVVYAVTWLSVHVILFGFVLQSYATWYSLPVFALLTILAGGGLASWVDEPSRLRRVGVAALSLFAVVSVSLYFLFCARTSFAPASAASRFGPRLESAAAATPGAVIGAFNAGALGYVASEYHDLRVVNLDGLVNNRVYEAARRGGYLDYVIETVDILFEPPDRASIFVGPQGLQVLESTYHKQADGMWHRLVRNRAGADSEQGSPR